jgi:hypothetical protein
MLEERDFSDGAGIPNILLEKKGLALPKPAVIEGGGAPSKGFGKST